MIIDVDSYRRQLQGPQPFAFNYSSPNGQPPFDAWSSDRSVKLYLYLALVQRREMKRSLWIVGIYSSLPSLWECKLWKRFNLGYLCAGHTNITGPRIPNRPA